METFGLFEAKTHLSELVARAERGEEVVITRHQRPVAKLVPITPLSKVSPALLKQRLAAVQWAAADIDARCIRSMPAAVFGASSPMSISVGLFVRRRAK